MFLYTAVKCSCLFGKDKLKDKGILSFAKNTFGNCVYGKETDV
jgi:hypothetical protein